MQTISHEDMIAQRVLTICLLLLIAAGATLRVHALGHSPYGLYQDEAINGLDALRVLDGAHPLYFEANNGREPLFIYAMAATIGMAGRTPLGVRAPAAIVGLLTLPAVYWMGSALANRRVGLLSAAILAVTLWHVHLSHIGFRAILLPLFTALFLSAGALAFKQKSRAWAVSAGALYGASFYTYLAVRFTPVALLGIALYGWLWHRDWLRQRTAIVLIILSAALIVALPLGVYTLQYPEIVLGRSGQVAIWNRADFPQVAVTNLFRTLGMFTWRGDTIWRHNVPGHPVFDPLLSIPFVAGVGLALARWRKRPVLVVCLIWTAVMALPTFLADDAPHFLRAVGVIPTVIVIPALVLHEAWEAVSRAYRRGEAVASAGIVVMLILSLFLTARDYFGCRPAPLIALSGYSYVGCYQTDPVRGYFFQAEATDLADAINQSQGTVFVDRRFWTTFPSVEFLAVHPDVSLYDEGKSLSTDAPSLTLFAWPYEGLDAALNVLSEDSTITVDPGPMTRGDLDPELLRLYVQFSAAPRNTAESSPPLAQFENGLRLADVRFTPSEKGEAMELSWSQTQPPDQPMNVFVHLVDEAGNIISQFDEPPGTIYYPPLSWRPGSVIIQTIRLSFLGTGQGRDLSIRLGLYDPTTGDRVHIAQTNLDQEDDALLFHLSEKAGGD